VLVAGALPSAGHDEHYDVEDLAIVPARVPGDERLDHEHAGAGAATRPTASRILRPIVEVSDIRVRSVTAPFHATAWVTDASQIAGSTRRGTEKPELASTTLSVHDVEDLLTASGPFGWRRTLHSLQRRHASRAVSHRLAAWTAHHEKRKRPR
jgi:hypothetical protein